jgi:hypothetical protein
MTNTQTSDSSEKQKPLKSEESAKQPTTSTESIDTVTPYVSHIIQTMQTLLDLKSSLKGKTSITKESLPVHYLVNTYFLHLGSELLSLKES